jgi:hypothetical protein
MLVGTKTWLAIAIGVAVMFYIYNKGPAAFRQALGGA